MGGGLQQNFFKNKNNCFVVCFLNFKEQNNLLNVFSPQPYFGVNLVQKVRFTHELKQQFFNDVPPMYRYDLDIFRSFSRHKVPIINIYCPFPPHKVARCTRFLPIPLSFFYHAGRCMAGVLQEIAATCMAACLQREGVKAPELDRETYIRKLEVTPALREKFVHSLVRKILSHCI